MTITLPKLPNLKNTRNKLIDISVNVLNKARPKELTIGQRIDAAINDKDMPEKIRAALITALDEALADA